jgi:hypothetical protein
VYSATSKCCPARSSCCSWSLCSCQARGLPCKEPQGKAVVCPNCQKGKIKCQINGVSHGDLGKGKGKAKSEAKSSAGSRGELAAILAILEKMQAENLEFHQELLAANRRHHLKVERLLTEAADLTYAYIPLRCDQQLAEEWQLITESEIELTNQALIEIKKAGKILTEWEYRGLDPSPDMQLVWEWFHRKGVINRRGWYIGGHKDLLSESESEEEKEVIELDELEGDEAGPSRAVNEASESGGPSGLSIGLVTETSERKSDDKMDEMEEKEGGKEMEGDLGVQAVEKGVEDMVMG